MSTSLQAYDALHSEPASTSQSLCQQQSQLSHETVEQSTVTPAPNPSQRIHLARFWKSWEWEFAACFLILIVPILVFATLCPHSGQPLPQWPFKVSINSLLSVYALVLKASIGFILTSCIGQLQWAWFSETRPLTDMLRFDGATRGADGALSLIWRQRFRQLLTALGCIVMVLAVAVDPFVQQLVRPVDCSIELSNGNAAATLPRTNVFDGFGYNGPTQENLMKVIESTLYNAVFSPGQGHTWQCPTGNCTFPETYGTNGICYSCQDVSADVVIQATCSRPDSSYASRHPTSRSDCPGDSSFVVESNFTAIESIQLGTQMSISSDYQPATPVLADANASVGPSSDVGVRDLLFGFLIGATANAGGHTDWSTSGNSTCESNKSEKSWSCQGYGAATCSLQPCVQIYNATISAGVLEEHLVASSFDTTWGMVTDTSGMPAYLALIDTQCPAEIQTSLIRDSSVEGRWLPYNLNLTDPNYVPMLLPYYQPPSEIHFPDDVTALLESGCLYLMSADIILGYTMTYLHGTVQADVTEYQSTVESGVAGSPDQPSDAEVEGMSKFEGPDIIRSIYNWGHTDFERVESIFANISDSYTTYIRTHGGGRQVSNGTIHDVQGKVYHYATCLQVQWPWLSYPASLAVLATLFFLMVVKATRKQGTSVWKASPLAWVLRAEGPGSEMFSSSHGSCKEMKARSTQIAVHLLDGDIDGPRIRMADLKDPNLC